MFDQAKADAICDGIAAGKSIRETGASTATVWRWAESNPAFASQYARAMEIRADVHADRIEQLADSVERGEIAPDAARVAIDARKWTASKLRPKKYGDRIAVDADMRLQVTIDDPTARATATLITPPLLPNDGK